MKTKAFARSRDERKRVEMRFAHLKTHHGFERLRLRGLSGARDEFHLAAIVQNLKTMALRLVLAAARPCDRIRCLNTIPEWRSLGVEPLGPGCVRTSTQPYNSKGIKTLALPTLSTASTHSGPSHRSAYVFGIESGLLVSAGNRNI